MRSRRIATAVGVIGRRWSFVKVLKAWRSVSREIVPLRHAAWIAEGAAALAGLYQHHRECHEHGAARMPEREAMALGLDGDALDRGRHAGSSQRLPTTEGSQAASNVAGPALEAHHNKDSHGLARQAIAANINLGSDRFPNVQHKAGHPRIPK
jgi:hypothetical protein